MNSSESSSSSLSPSPSTAGAGYHEKPNLDRIVSYFVSAKRALNTTQHIRQATELVSDTRRLIEELAASTAKNAFGTGKIKQQIDTLHDIRQHLAETGATIDDEFQIVIGNLDAANDRLQTALTALKSTVVDISLRKKQEGSLVRSSHDDDINTDTDTQKTLFDFVDESQYEAVSDSLRVLIDSFQGSRSALEGSLDKFKDDIQEVGTLLDLPPPADSLASKPMIYDEPLQPVSEAFSTMEEHAGEMANLLQSLISHYDLCVSALKHTEGGREAAKNAVLASDDTSQENPMDDSLFGVRLAEPISDAERKQMLSVLEVDAEEVEDVVSDIRERGADLERLHAQFQRRSDTSNSRTKTLRTAIDMLLQIRQDLPEYSSTASDFHDNWLSIRSSIDAKMQEIIDFGAFYEGFVLGYEKLLREVDRREIVASQMKKIASKAQKELDHLYEADHLARDDFFQHVASYLPSDLWHGVAEPAVRWEVKAASPAIEATSLTSSKSQAEISP